MLDPQKPDEPDIVYLDRIGAVPKWFAWPMLLIYFGVGVAGGMILETAIRVLEACR